MRIIWFYVRKAFTLFKSEVLVLPSRVAVLVFVVALLLIPLVTQDPYLLRILIFTSIFAIFAASWDLLSGFTGQINFGHALFFGVAAYTSGLINVHAKAPYILSIPAGGICRSFDWFDRWNPVSQVEGHLSRADHLGLPHNSSRSGICHTGCDGRRAWNHGPAEPI